ncbi:MAG TPA: nucleoside deaminase [Terriglobales bacterium]|nr:nucleoside deaminase [Terriglobales bacterium]
MPLSDEAAMRAAIAVAQRGIALGQSPFGTVIVETATGALVAEAHNQVWATCDPTAHAEINAIRAAASARANISLAGCTLYSTCEPCPMCLAACHWARLDRIVFGARIADARASGFNELSLPAADLLARAASPLALTADCLAPDCRALFQQWQSRPASRPY